MVNVKVDYDTKVEVEPATYKLLSEALGRFFFLQVQSGDSNEKLDLLIRNMEREEIEAGHLLINEGEAGSKLYVVASGELDVTINGDFIRKLSTGHMLGELALLYDAPRSATVRCITNCVLWSLGRGIFKDIQRSASQAVKQMRMKWLAQSEELSALPEMDLAVLVGNLQTMHYETNQCIYNEKVSTNRCIVIENGKGKVYTNRDVSGKSKEEIVKSLGIILGPNPPPPDDTEPDASLGTYVCDVYQGCFIGNDILLAKAGTDTAWEWLGPVDGQSSFSGTRSPITLAVSARITGLTFTVDMFENHFGPLNKLLDAYTETIAQIRSDDYEPVKEPEITFDSTKFKMKYIFGSGSFGVVLYAEYKSPDGTMVPYALKALSKLSVSETGQLRHVLDERKLLAAMNNRFILKLYGTYQTPHQLIMVTEPLNCGDLWNVIYEVAPYSEHEGLSLPLAVFYTASIVLALAHIHAKGVVFRDLKPENVMLDEKGYLRVIDFGFAKQVPYTRVDAQGVSRVMAKTYTLCGTPEYLAPELIFNLGHDQAADIWALGVLLHEMLMAVTPFAPKKADNVTELFTNIAMVKKTGLKLSETFTKKVEDPSAKDLITSMLMAESSDRIGIKEGNAKFILDHPFFRDLNVKALKSGTLVPEYIPEPQSQYEPISNLVPVKPYRGDQAVFAEF